MATKDITLKLMIDPNSKRLIFAEASKDFVDFLIFLLSLPIATVIKLLNSESMLGSIGNIYTSISNLNQSNLQPNINKSILLNPVIFSSITKIPLSIDESSIISSGKFYTCVNCKCKSGITNTRDGVYCVNCAGMMNEEIKFVTQCFGDKDSQGYVKKEASYMISDDLSITLLSTMSIVSMMNKFNVSKLDEMKVEIGCKEALELLKTSLQSTTVLTDVFLNKKNEEQGLIPVLIG